MLEKSVVSERDIRSILTDMYGIDGIDRVTPLTGGSANCFLIQVPGGKFVLKEFQSRYSLVDVEPEPGIAEFVRARGIPTVRFVRTVSGTYVWAFRQRTFHLQEFIEGEIFPSNAAPDWLMQEMAALLGRLHRILLDHPPLKQGFHAGWFSQWDADESRNQYLSLLEEAEQLPTEEPRERILADLRYRIAQLPALARVRIDPARLTRRNSHGDYHVLQLICGPNAVRVVIDFSGACSLPVIWEIIRSYTLSDPCCAQGRIDLSRLRDYVRLYLESGGELTRYDLEMMPHLYHLQLVRSLYGYREFLSRGRRGFIPDPAASRESLLEFGCWRTDMCRWLEERAGDLSQELGTWAE